MKKSLEVWGNLMVGTGIAVGIFSGIYLTIEIIMRL